MREIRGVVLHCSDSDHDHHDNLETLYQWHVCENGWSDIGYHYVILKDGTIKEARPVWKQGAHCREGGMNRGTIGICLTGKTSFTVAQFDALARLLRKMMEKYKIDETDIYGHYHFSSKTCPNFNVTEFKENYL
jgi:N-acetyl-anhydromuramyl-L-alanine amidase AmpD